MNIRQFHNFQRPGTLGAAAKLALALLLATAPAACRSYYFDATPANIFAGERTTLSWHVAAGGKLTIQPVADAPADAGAGIESFVGPDAELIYSPEISTTYTLDVNAAERETGITHYSRIVNVYKKGDPFIFTITRSQFAVDTVDYSVNIDPDVWGLRTVERVSLENDPVLNAAASITLAHGDRTAQFTKAQPVSDAFKSMPLDGSWRIWIPILDVAGSPPMHTRIRVFIQ
ncbi:MAG: hypothetical protein HY286_17650 [Planctomycetes bacterium]|nr:hypothetical protein [Planctomycetota bacterium]